MGLIHSDIFRIWVYLFSIFIDVAGGSLAVARVERME